GAGIGEDVGLHARGPEQLAGLYLGVEGRVPGLGAGGQVQRAARGGVAGLVAVGDEDDQVGAAGPLGVGGLDEVVEVHARVEQRPPDGRVPVVVRAQLGVVDGGAGAGV